MQMSSWGKLRTKNAVGRMINSNREDDEKKRSRVKGGMRKRDSFL